MTPERQLDILTTTRARIANPRHWGQVYFVRNSFWRDLLGIPQRVCLMGAVTAAAHDMVNPPARWHHPDRWGAEADEISFFFYRLLNGERTALNFNDRNCHASVLELVDLAIAETRLALQSELVTV